MYNEHSKQREEKYETKYLGTSLAVQWLRLHTSTARCVGLIHDQRTEIPHIMRCGQNKMKNSAKDHTIRLSTQE